MADIMPCLEQFHSVTLMRIASGYSFWMISTARDLPSPDSAITAPIWDILRTYSKAAMISSVTLAGHVSTPEARRRSMALRKSSTLASNVVMSDGYLLPSSARYWERTAFE